MREIYIRKSDGMDVAVVEDGNLVEFFPSDDAASTEAIYLGRVERIMPGMRAAFVQIGQEKCGFLPLEERNAIGLPKLQCGMSIIVQIKKEAQGVKGAFLTRDICLCGEFVLLSPLSRLTAVSSRITKEKHRKRLKALGKAISGEEYGLIMRSAALDADEQLIRNEAAELHACWAQICRTAATAPAPSVLHAPRTNLELVLADYHPKQIDRICTNDASMASLVSEFAPVAVMGDDLFDVARISTQLQKAMDRRIWLRSGGNLVFDPCEAMTVIDVNTAKFTGKDNPAETVLQTNLEACEEIARQVRLRNISGIIIIDMIDMVSRAHQSAVLEALNRAFADDRVKTVVHGFTSLGLVEMTRRRSRPPIRELLNKESHQLEE